MVKAEGIGGGEEGVGVSKEGEPRKHKTVKKDRLGGNGT